jgi:hypothetical protein
MFLHVSWAGLHEKLNMGGSRLTGELKLKGAAFDTPFFEIVEITTTGLKSNL